MRLSHQSVGSVLTPVTVRIEMNTRTPDWCLQRTEELLGVRELL